ncbi:NADPH:quinone reductase-like Zn-dependent oxidoreductase [Actinomycetospora succinea]|uniref:NADPH:quinone reductase-like Zn-dependent oxidoreductase n=1 Tax=Actinomycetospora succinea TaxID=663603 RepID=A0A4R6VEI9_9PSEU|nr:NADP-dependent oxidoreductase [Actinomycetospora succinea]TDQ61243.1 NADPH:quinone reductase-like Zn-dependent oxidoreductase [Actinomycetospora succinea]
MRRITQDTAGGPEVLHVTDAPVPEPIPTEIRVRVTAAGVNPVDTKVRAGGAGLGDDMTAPPFTVGWDVAGVVDAVGMGVTRFAVGDRVFGMPWFPREAGGYGEYVTAPSRQFAHIPDGVDDVTAAATPLAALTAWQIVVDTADVQCDQRVLVHAAGGGVGHLAVQIAKTRGAYVVGTASASKHAELAALGLDEAIDHHTQDVARATRDIDVAVDLTEVNGPSSLAVTRPGGLLVCVPSGVPEGLTEQAHAEGKRVTDFLVEPDGIALTGIARLLAEGALSVRVAGTFPLEEAASAHRELEKGSTFGKLVLTL